MHRRMPLHRLLSLLAELPSLVRLTAEQIFDTTFVTEVDEH
jgi:hypothetical protein